MDHYQKHSNLKQNEKKSIFYNKRKRAVKESKYIYYVKKAFCGCFRIEEIHNKDNQTGLKKKE